MNIFEPNITTGYECCICKRRLDVVLETGNKRYCECCISKALKAQYKEDSIDDKIIMEIDKFTALHGKCPENLYLGTTQAVGRRGYTHLGLRVFYLQAVASHIAVS